LFNRQIRCMDTNGKLLVEKADEIIDNLDTITISVFEKDDETEEQNQIIKQFIEIKKDRKPRIVVRYLGDVDLKEYDGCLIATRALHSPLGSFGYRKVPTVPEIGICLDALSRMAISANGDVSMCVRFDPFGLGVIGNCAVTSLVDIWNSPQRLGRIKKHIAGRRGEMPLCDKCDFWGVPTG